MLMRTGLYPNNSPAQGQILRLSRYRAARIGVDVNLHTGRWSFEQAVKYFMDAGGLDREAAEGEAAGAASEPTQKISYIIGKWQIMNLLGRYKDRQGENFRLGAFHDDLIKNGSLPKRLGRRSQCPPAAQSGSRPTATCPRSCRSAIRSSCAGSTSASPSWRSISARLGAARPIRSTSERISV